MLPAIVPGFHCQMPGWHGRIIPPIRIVKQKNPVGHSFFRRFFSTGQGGRPVFRIQDGWRFAGSGGWPAAFNSRKPCRSCLARVWGWTPFFVNKTRAPVFGRWSVSPMCEGASSTLDWRESREIWRIEAGRWRQREAAAAQPIEPRTSPRIRASIFSLGTRRPMKNGPNSA